MAHRSLSTPFQPIERLIGRENYRSWAVAMRAYLEVEDLWDTVQSTQGTPLNTDPKKMQKARGRLVLAVEPDVYAYIESATSPKDVWDELAKTFDDPSLNQKVFLLQEASTTKLENCKSMEDYISRIISATKKLASIGTVLPQDLIGALLLAGLPASYKPLIMALSSSNQEVTADLVKGKLLEESDRDAGSNFESRGLHVHAQAPAAQFVARGRSNGRKNHRGRHVPRWRQHNTRSVSQIRCFNCNGSGHFANECPHPNKRNQSACAVAADDEDDAEETVCALLTSCDTRDTPTVAIDIVSVVDTAEQTSALLAIDHRSDNSEQWILDSGASMHMCKSATHMVNVRKSKTAKVIAANRAVLPVEKQGDILLTQQGADGKKKVLLTDVLHVPSLTTNLLSVSAITKKGCRVSFSGSRCIIYDRNNRSVLEGILSVNNIYKLNVKLCPLEDDKLSVSVALSASVPTSIEIWHRRLGHLNATYLQQLSKVATGIQLQGDQLHKCEICVIGKLVNKPFSINSKRASSPLQLVHSDVCQVESPSMGNAKYFITFLDDYSRKIFVYFIKNKFEVPETIEKFIRMAETQTGCKLKTLRTDNGREYVNATLKTMLEKMGVSHQTSIPYQPQQNGRAERVNRTLLEKTRCMLAESRLPKHFWAEAVSTAAYLSNRSPKKCLGGSTPEELWSGVKPDLSHLRIFGSRARAFIPSNQRSKIEPTSKEAIMLGYCTDQKGYRLWSPDQNKVFTASNVEFFEEASEPHAQPSTIYLPLESTQPMDQDNDIQVPANNEDKMTEESKKREETRKRRITQDLPVFNDVSEEPVKKKAHLPVREIKESPEAKGLSEVDKSKETTVPPKLTTLKQPGDLARPMTRSMSSQQQQGDESSDEELTTKPVQRSQRRRTRPKRLDDYVVYSAVSASGEPSNYQEAVSGAEASQWKQAMQSEYDSIIKNDTWELSQLPAGEKVIGSKWVYKKKITAEGNTRYKARLVAQGFSQVRGVHYEETYSPVVRFTSLRILFAYAVRHNLEIFHLDIETAFLHGNMAETVYLQQPQGFQIKGEENKVCLLRKAIYGLKQGSRNWNQKLDNTLKSMNLHQSNYDSCIYSYFNKNKCILIALFVDDLIVVTNSIDFFQILKENLNKMCTVKDLGHIQKCLGINVHCDRTRGIIQIDQSDYISSLLDVFGMSECRSTTTPMDPNGSSNNISPQKKFNPADVPYQNAVGSLLYLVQGTRPDLAFAVSTISKFNNCFDESHWTIVKRIFRYLQGTKNLSLNYCREGNTEIIGYCDASWATDPSDSRSVSGYVFNLQGGAVSWNSRRQSTVALSSTEAEYLSLSAATQEALWLNRFAQELLIMPRHKALIIYCDNKGAIDLSKNSKFSSRTKHINVRHHFIRGSIDRKEIEVKFTPSTHMLADALTKATNQRKLEEFTNAIGLKRR